MPMLNAPLTRDPVFAASQRATALLGPVQRGRMLADSICGRTHDTDEMTWLDGHQWNDLAAYIAALRAEATSPTEPRCTL